MCWGRRKVHIYVVVRVNTSARNVTLRANVGACARSRTRACVCVSVAPLEAMNGDDEAERASDGACGREYRDVTQWLPLQ